MKTKSFFSFGFLIPLLVSVSALRLVAEQGTAATPTATAASPVFQGEQKKIKEAIEQLFEASKHVNAKDKVKKNSARASIEGALDWDRVAKDCMGKYWAKESAANREAFKKILREVMVKTAYTRLDTFWDDTTFTFDKIDVKGNEAFASSKFVVKSDMFSLEYYFFKKGARWFINDISYEDLRYSSNIREQIEAFLKEKNFSALMDKLKKRRDDLDRGVKGAAQIPGATIKK